MAHWKEIPTRDINLDRQVNSFLNKEVNDNFNTTRPIEIDTLTDSIRESLRWPNQAYPIKFYGINLLEYIAECFKQKVFGKGVEIKTENPDLEVLIKEIFSGIDLFSFCNENESLVSVWGASIIFIEFVEGKIRWILANPWNLNIMNFLDDITKSRLMLTLGSGIEMKVDFDLNKTTIEYVIGAELDENEVRRKYGLRDYSIVHNFNQKPVYFFLNKPSFNIYGTTLSQRKPDMMNCIGYQTMINKIMQTAYYELQMGKTRAYGMLSKQQYREMQQIPNGIFKAFCSGINATLLNSKQDMVPGAQPKWLEVIQANPVFENYLNSINTIIQFAKMAVGLSNEDDSRGLQKTQLEIDYINSDSNETVAIRKKWRCHQIKELVIRSILIADPRWSEEKLKEEIHISLRENLGTDRAKRIEECAQLEALGLISKKGMLQQIYDLDKIEAEIKWQEIIMEQEEEAEEIVRETANVEQEKEELGAPETNE